jgi:protein phosphatase
MKISNLDEAVELLIDETKEYGAPDNVTVLLLEVHDESELGEYQQPTTWLGSAANEVVIKQNSAGRILEMFSPKAWLDAFRDVGRKETFYSVNDPALERAIGEFDGKVRSWKKRGLALMLALAIVTGGSLWGIYSYIQTRYYLGVQDGNVAIFQGIKESFGGIGFSSLYKESDLKVVDLPEFQQELILKSISAESLEDAEAKLSQILESSKDG